MATLLLITVMLPLLVGLVLGFAPGLTRHQCRMAALAGTLVTLGLSLILVIGYHPETSSVQFAFVGDDGQLGLTWLGATGIRFALGLDGLSLWLFVLTSVLTITSVCASWESINDRPGQYYGLLLALETGLLGLFASLDVVLFYIFFEFTLIPLFFIIGIWGGPKRKQAAVTFFLYTLAGSLLTLLGVISLVVVHYQYSPGHLLTFSIPDLTSGLAALNWPEWRDTRFWSSPQVLIFLLLAAGFAIKVPMFPFHTWLPLAHVEAPTAGSIILAGVLLKVGTYGLLRFNLGMTPLGSIALQPLMVSLAVAGVIYGALAAIAQQDVKRLVAYSSVSHMGFIVLGLFSFTVTGIEGGVIQQINHGLTTGALFACVGMVYERYHTRDLSKLSGLWDRSGVLAFFFIVAALGSAAVPLLCGFVGEFPILTGAFAAAPRAAVLAATGMILGAGYLLLMLKKLIFGPLKEPGGEQHGHGHTAFAPLGLYEIAGMAPLVLLIVLIGVFPGPFLEHPRQTLTDFVESMDEQSRPRPILPGERQSAQAARTTDHPDLALSRGDVSR